MSKHAFVGGKLVDGTGAAPVEDSVVLVDDKTITYAGSRTEVPDGYEVHDATGHTVMPGLIDSHLHFSGNLTDNDNDWVIESVAQKQACAVKQAYDALTHGLTTVVEIGRNGIAIRDLVNMGIMAGPRIFATGLGFCRVAGHGDSHHLPLQISKDGHPWGDQVDGPWELRKAIRRRLRENPDGIKIWATGGGIWRWDSDRLQLFSTEEIKAIADECKLVGIPLYAHSYNNFDAAYDCVRFGCTQLIHGFELDENLRKAYELGITITIGSDSFSFVTPYGYVTIDEMYDFVDKVGVSILDTISAATYNGAKMLGKEDEFGAVKEGLSADLLVVKGDVASNIHDLTPENMDVIMKEGTIITRGSF